MSLVDVLVVKVELELPAGAPGRDAVISEDQLGPETVKPLSRLFRGQTEREVESLLVDVFALSARSLGQAERVSNVVLQLELGLDHPGGVESVGVRWAPLVLK